MKSLEFCFSKLSTTEIDYLWVPIVLHMTQIMIINNCDEHTNQIQCHLHTVCTHCESPLLHILHWTTQPSPATMSWLVVGVRFLFSIIFNNQGSMAISFSFLQFYSVNSQHLNHVWSSNCSREFVCSYKPLKVQQHSPKKNSFLYKPLVQQRKKLLCTWV